MIEHPDEAGRDPRAGAEARLRVLTYNVRLGGRAGEPLQRVLLDVAPDVLLVNEAPKRPVVSTRDCRRLCATWGLRYVVGGRSAGSNLIAVAAGVEVVDMDAEVLRQPRLRPRRGIASAQLRVTGRLMGVVSCHLSLDADRRADEAERVVAAAARLRGPVVVAGDLNEPPGAPAWEVLRRAGFVDHGDAAWPTFPADAPDRRIDALLVRGDVEVAHHGDPGVAAGLLGAASDHRPVLADLRL